ncbi:MAG: alcohol dehydrogenase catalytic domain-containing protein [Polyangiaceae bacterium]
MRAVVLDRPGSASELVLREVPDPEIGESDVLVRVRACGVCGRDLIDRRGGFPAMKLPTILGHEFAGEVVRVGGAVRELAPGDRVASLHRPWCGYCEPCVGGRTSDCERAYQSFGHTVDGGYAELCAAHERALVKIPDGIEYERAAFLGCTAGVVWKALREHGGLWPGAKVLVTGASGGVGLAAIEVAKAWGAEVIAITSSEAKRGAIEALGADHVLVSAGAFAADARARARGGVDVALELTGSATFGQSLRSLRTGGSLIVVGNLDVGKVSLSLGHLILGRYRIAGARSYTRSDLEDCFRLVATGKLHPQVALQLPLGDARLAHERLEARGVVGRIVLLPDR